MTSNENLEISLHTGEVSSILDEDRCQFRGIMYKKFKICMFRYFSVIRIYVTFVLIHNLKWLVIASMFTCHRPTLIWYYVCLSSRNFKVSHYFALPLLSFLLPCKGKRGKDRRKQDSNELRCLICIIYTLNSWLITPYFFHFELFNFLFDSLRDITATSK